MRSELLLVGTLAVMCIPLYAQTTLSYNDYEKTLSQAMEKDRVFREQIAQEQALITEYKTQLLDHKNAVLALRAKKLEVLGVTSEHLQTVAEELDSMQSQLVAIKALGDQELLLTEFHLTTLVVLKDSLKHDPAVKLPMLKKKHGTVTDLLNRCLERIAALKTKPPELPVVASPEVATAAVVPAEPVSLSNGNYTVSSRSGKPETLYEISAKMYGDPYKWPLIYRANKKLLDKNFNRFKTNQKAKSIAEPSDLILPGQVLLIPRD